MNQGWIKLHRKLIDNEIFKDEKALKVFIWLLLTVDRNTGIRTLGRFQASDALRMNPNTFKDVLKRLVSKYKVITTESNGLYTIIKIINWSLYQSTQNISIQTEKKTPQVFTTKDRFHTNDLSPQENTIQSTTPTTTLNTTKQETENRELRNITNVISEEILEPEMLIQDKNKIDKRNPDLNEVSNYFLQKLELPKEDCSYRESRKYWSLLIREVKNGNPIEAVKKLIDLAANDDFYKNNITSSKDLYYKRIKLMVRKRGRTVKIGIMGEDGNLSELRLDKKDTENKE